MSNRLKKQLKRSQKAKKNINKLKNNFTDPSKLYDIQYNIHTNQKRRTKKQSSVTSNGTASVMFKCLDMSTVNYTCSNPTV
jgi:hypothetical protein